MLASRSQAGTYVIGPPYGGFRVPSSLGPHRALDRTSFDAEPRFWYDPSVAAADPRSLLARESKGASSPPCP